MRIYKKALFSIFTLTLIVSTTICANAQTNGLREIKKEAKAQTRENRDNIKSGRQINRIEQQRQRDIRKEQRRSLTGEIQLSGAFALYPMVVKWAEEFRKLYPKVRIDISAGGAGKGITDALSNVVDLGMVSRDINEAELAKGAFVISVARDAVVGTVNSKNPLHLEIITRGMTKEAARNLWVTGSAKTWGDIIGTDNNMPVHVYTRSDACGAAETWAKWLGSAQEDLCGTAVFGDPGVASVIQRDRVGIGFNNLAYVFDWDSKKPHRGLMVIPIDTNGDGLIDLNEGFYSSLEDLTQAIADGRYPSPPSRELYLICNGAPEKAETRAFLEFILTTGQSFALENGFVPLSEEVLRKELEKLGL